MLANETFQFRYRPVGKKQHVKFSPMAITGESVNFRTLSHAFSVLICAPLRNLTEACRASNERTAKVKL